MRKIISLLLPLILAGLSLDAATFIVSSALDDGPGSLRQAILDANGTNGKDAIHFNLGAGGPQTLKPLNALPEITDPVELDASTQTGFVGTPIIEIDGSSSGASGLRIRSSACVVRGLVVNRVPGNGIELIGGGGHLIAGNYIGTDLSGTAARANFGRGIYIQGSQNNVIGGATELDRNVVSGNFTAGIEILRIPFTPDSFADGNRVAGNYIGMDANGFTSLPNGNGINLLGPNNTVVGGSAPGEGNFIGGNFIGILVRSDGGEPATGNRIEGNFILGNMMGISLSTFAANTMVGGIQQGAGNIIVGQIGRGVVISGFGAINNTIRGNRIYSNGRQGNELGIDLAFDGVTPNDAGDVDAGENGRQNFPVLNAVSSTSSSMRFIGSLSSLPLQEFTIDFYSNTARHPTGFGEGENYLGSTVVNTGSDGIAVFDVEIPGRLLGRHITATATDANGNTSEFSLAILATSSAPGSVFVVNNTNDSGEGSLRDAIEKANKVVTSGDTVTFNIPGSGPFTIIPSSALPEVSDILTIDGTTQPGYAGVPIIQLSGSLSGLGTVPDGLRITSGDCVIRGLVINRFANDGIELVGSSNNRIQNCYIGLNQAGNGTAPNGARGIFINNSGNNSIGGIGSALGNILSGNNSHGIEISGTSATNNAILGNIIGLTATGAEAGNNQQGVLLNAANNFIGGVQIEGRNVIAGNRGHGISLPSVAASGNSIQGNLIGLALTPSGTVKRPNRVDGIFLSNGSRNRIGGSVLGAGNIIGANLSQGIEINGINAIENRVEGNFIGIDMNSEARGNSGNGILFNSASRNIVGGLELGMGNTIANKMDLMECLYCQELEIPFLEIVYYRT